jgi:putative peptide zinc metalloprotease protein
MSHSGSRARKPVRVLLTVLLSLLLGWMSVAPAAADNVAVSINTKDGFSVWSFAFKVTRTMKDVVDETNAAAAASSCKDCQNIAVALQVVLIMSDASVIAPTNLALALNVDCNSCETLASAYQWVFTTGGPVHFTAAGNRRLAEIRHAFLELLKNAENLTLAEIQAKISELAAQLADVLKTELVPAGGGGSQTTPGSTQPGSPAPASSSSPAGTSPSPSPSESASPSPSPS